MARPVTGSASSDRKQVNLTNLLLAAVGFAVVVNMGFTLAVVRRLREHELRFSDGGRYEEVSGHDGVAIGLADGAAVDDVTVTTTRGQDVRLLDGARGTIVGFFMPGCQSCRKERDVMTAEARALEAGHRLIAVVVSLDEQDPRVPEYTTQLEDVAAVVLERHDGPMSSLFSVRAFPAFAVLSADGVLQASGTVISELGLGSRDPSPV
jgi:hypothetical protein